MLLSYALILALLLHKKAPRPIEVDDAEAS